MSGETYLSHPTFGLLFRVCVIEDRKELFTTLYAQRLFFVVITSPQGLQFESVTRGEARILLENRLRSLRREGKLSLYDELMAVHKRTFQ
ncbi:transcriptional coactivator PipX [Roseofilum capinflatum]|uniref:PipX family protein n=1 Tax=Roseofilum capinflatum BLCC-M114 TaxID=3022440 RepID=A0ABT7B3P3_9CYAN|nr:PipX family protein [Roseofilum capinflatum]MDJ1173754.1 PipX family protein [Roseofilum capinflatum BLCC-M114]